MTAVARKPETVLRLVDPSALELATQRFSLESFPHDLNAFLRESNGGSPERAMFVTDEGKLFTLMTFFYLFLPRPDNEALTKRIDDELRVLWLLEHYPFAQKRLFPLAKLHSGDCVTYALGGERQGRIFVVEGTTDGQGYAQGYDLERYWEAFPNLNSFLIAAR